MNKAIRKVVIAGGGTAGWMTAALLRKVLPSHVALELVESEQIGIVGVGEATIPPIQIFNRFLNLDEQAFLKETKATIKLAIRFENWRVQGEHYYHTFGAPGANVGFCAFHHHWLRGRKLGMQQSLWDYDLHYLACEQGLFNKVNSPNPVHQLAYAYHFDSALYGQFMRRLAEKAGVIRTEGIIEQVHQDAETGDIAGLTLQGSQRIDGDLFVDCTGFRGLLIRKTLGVEYEDWSHFLPADSAFAVPTARFDKTVPFTRAIAHRVGWQWRIPLTHRNGNGIVYSSRYMTDDEAQATLMSNLDSEPLDEPRKISFITGRTVQQWHKNVVAIGLSSGFLEPLESTSIHLIQSGIVRLMKMFPNNGIDPATVALYNAESKEEFETIRDFIILHYHVNERDDSEFWRDMRNMSIPDRLQQKLDVFKATAAIFNEEQDIFRDASWIEVMLGQGIMPRDYHPAADAMPEAQFRDMMHKVWLAKREPMSMLVPHDRFLQQVTGT